MGILYFMPILPSNTSINAKMIVWLGTSDLSNAANHINTKINLNFDNDYINIENLELEYQDKLEKNSMYSDLVSEAKIFIKKGAIDKLAESYDIASKIKYKQNAILSLFNNELKFIVGNEEKFKLRSLENQNYDFKLSAISLHSGNSRTTIKDFNIREFSLFGTDSGFRIDGKFNLDSASSKKVNADGIIYLRNYPNMVDFTSNYIYRINAFKLMQDDLKDIYTNVAKKFLRKLSDQPHSISDDLTMKFYINSNDLYNMNLGSLKIAEIIPIFEAEIFKEITYRIGDTDNLAKAIQDIAPNLNLDSPIIKRALPLIEKHKSSNPNVTNKIKDKLNRIIPRKTEEDLAKKIVDKLF